MSSILSRYILRETAQTWIVVTLVLLLILLTNTFAQVLGDAASGRLPRDAVFYVMALTSIQYLTILIPVGLFLSVMLALGRLYSDSEMAALMACGIGPAALYRPLSLLAFALALLVGWLALDVAPRALYEIQVVAEDTKKRLDLRVLEAGRFINLGEANAVMYAETISADGVLGNVFVQRAVDAEVEVVVAKRAWQSESGDENVKILTFADGRRYKGEPGKPVFEIISFKEHGIPYALPAAEPVKLKPESRPLRDLIGSGDPELTAELQWRLSVPLSTLVLMVIAVPLSRSQPRQGRYGGLAIGVLVFIIYVDLLAAGKVWVEREQVPPLIGIWWVHLLFLAVGGILLARQFGYFNRLKLKRS